MSNLVANEFLKLRTVRWPWLLLLAQLALVVAGVSGMVVVRGDRPIDVQLALSHVGLTSLLTLVLGIMAVAGEYRDRTIADTYLATPRRSRVIAAKLITYTLVATLFAVAAALAALIATWAWLAARNASLDVASPAVWQTLVGAVIWDACFAAIGVGLGALLPNLGGAITLGLAWIAIVEGIVAELVGSDLARWLPLAAGRALENSAGQGLLPQWAGGVVLAGYVALFGALAVAATVRRDVT